MRTKKTDLLTEVNIMRSMMGLMENKMLIMEQGIIGLAKAFVKSATELAVKSADNLMDEIMGGVGSLAAAKRMKTMVDDLDSAIKVGDETAMKAVVTNLVNSADFGRGITTKIVDDMFADTADDALSSALTKKANTLKGRGLPDAEISKALKEDIVNLLSGFPDRLVSAAKNKVDNTINWGGKGTTIPKGLTADDVFAKLGGSETWRKFTTRFPEELAGMTTKIDDLIAAGAKNADEVANIIIAQAQKKMNPNLIKRIIGLARKYPRLTTAGLVLISLGALRWYAGDVGLWNKIKMFGCDLIGGAASETCQEWQKELDEMEKEFKNEENKKEENTKSGNCDQNLASFKAYITSQNFNTDGATFDTNTCTGLVDGVDFTYDTTLKTWK